MKTGMMTVHGKTVKTINRKHNQLNIFGIKEQMDTITNRYNKWLYLFHISSC